MLPFEFIKLIHIKLMFLPDTPFPTKKKSINIVRHPKH